jgi:hypothetical protein
MALTEKEINERLEAAKQRAEHTGDRSALRAAQAWADKELAKLDAGGIEDVEELAEEPEPDMEDLYEDGPFLETVVEEELEEDEE